MTIHKTTARAHLVHIARVEEAEAERRQARAELDEAEGKLRLFGGKVEQREAEAKLAQYRKACQRRREAESPTAMMMAFTNASKKTR